MGDHDTSASGFMARFGLVAPGADQQASADPPQADTDSIQNDSDADPRIDKVTMTAGVRWLPWGTMCRFIAVAETLH